jgi:hypothetical protein
LPPPPTLVLLEALIEEIRPKERLAQRDLEEYERRRRGQ